MPEPTSRFRPAGWPEALFALLGGLLLAFLAAPLAALLLAAPRAGFLEVWRDPEVLRAVGVSLGCAAVAVALGLLLGVPLGYLIERRAFRGRGLLLAGLSLPLVIPHPVAGIALLLVFSRGSLLGSLLEERLGVAVVGAAPGIVLAMLFVSAPFVVRAAQQGFREGQRLEAVARSLGASPAAAFARVSLPLAWPAIAAGAASAYARAISEFGSIVVLAYFPRSAPVLIWDRFSAYGLRAALPATAFLLGVTLVVFWLWSAAERYRRNVARR